MEMAPADASARGASSAPDDMPSKRPAPASPPVAALNASPPNSPPAKSAKGPDAASPEPARSLAGAFAAASRAPLPAPSGLPRLRVFAPPDQPSEPSAGATAHQEPCTGLPEGPPSLFARLECLDAEADAQADADFFNTLSGGSTANATFVAAPVDGFFVPDDDNLMREAENHFKSSVGNDRMGVSVMRVPIFVSDKACVALVFTSSGVNEAKHFVQENMSSPFNLGGALYLAYPSIEAYISAASDRVDLFNKPSFVIMLAGLPCVNERSMRSYKSYLEKRTFEKRGARVDNLIALNVKSCGVDTARKSGKLIVTLRVEDVDHLRDLRITKVPAFLDGNFASYWLSTRAGNLRIIEANEEKVTTLSCCGVLKGPDGARSAHGLPDCFAFLTRIHAKTQVVQALQAKREHRAHVAARARVFANAANELEKIAVQNGYTRCKRFFATGRCTFSDSAKGCRHYPCNAEGKRSASTCALLDSLK